jgi:hypothetical protein
MTQVQLTILARRPRLGEGPDSADGSGIRERPP